MTSHSTISTADFGGRGEGFPPSVAEELASAIIAGGQFASTCTPVPTANGQHVFPILDNLTGNTWVGEGQDIPDVQLTTDALVSTAKKIAGIIMLSNESLDDEQFDIWNELVRLCQAKFSADIDHGFLLGDPDATPNSPRGLFHQIDTVASSTSTPYTLTAAITEAWAAIGEAGGTPTHIALSPTAFSREMGREDANGNAVHPDGLTSILGLVPVVVPGLAAPVVYSSAQLFVVTSRALTVTPSTDYAPAFKADKTAMRITGRFDLAVPVPAKAARTLTLTAD